MSAITRMLTIPQATAAAFGDGVHPRTLKRNAIDCGKLKTFRLGKKTFIHPEDLEDYLKRERSCQSTSAVIPGKSLSATMEKDIDDLLGSGIGPRLVRSKGS